MAALSTIRAIARVRKISTGTYKKPVTKSGPEASRGVLRLPSKEFWG